MSVAMHEAGNGTTMPTSMLRTLLRMVGSAFEAHAKYRVRSALPPAQLQQTDREMRRYRRLMQAGSREGAREGG